MHSLHCTCAVCNTLHQAGRQFIANEFVESAVPQHRCWNCLRMLWTKVLNCKEPWFKDCTNASSPLTGGSQAVTAPHIMSAARRPLVIQGTLADIRTQHSPAYCLPSCTLTPKTNCLAWSAGSMCVNTKDKLSPACQLMYQLGRPMQCSMASSALCRCQVTLSQLLRAKGIT